MNLARICGAALLVLCAWWIIPAVNAETPKSTVQTLVMLFSAWNGRNDNQGFYEEAAKNIDYSEMCEAAVGKEHWDKISAGDRQQLADVLKHLIEARYYPRWHKMFYSGKLEYENEISMKGDVFVKTILSIGD